ncbi:glycoside hydrolase family 75 protein [Paenibacillus mucilaginosus]|nr:glycoside hydrolase family 75 protein [Paenibacillus mucilaginosus]
MGRKFGISAENRPRANPETAFTALSQESSLTLPTAHHGRTYGGSAESLGGLTLPGDPDPDRGDEDMLRAVPSPQETTEEPDLWPAFVKKGHTMAVFKARDINKNIPIYNARASYFFMSKMAVEETGCYSICDHSVRPCGKCFTSEAVPFFVMPHNTNWIGLGDYGVVINTRTKQAAYAICADWGPKEQATVLKENTVYSGKIGEGSIHLGKLLNIKDIAPHPKRAFEPYGVLYILFPNSSTGARVLQSAEEINRNAHRHFKKWGGWKQAKYVLKEHFNQEI